MRAFVDEAQEDMLGAVYATAEVKSGLQNRWQQREAMISQLMCHTKAKPKAKGPTQNA